MKKIFRIILSSALLLSLGSSVFFYKIWSLSREREEKSKLEIQALEGKNSEQQELIKLIKESQKRNEGILKTWSEDHSKITDLSRDTIFKIMQAQSGKISSKTTQSGKILNYEKNKSRAAELAEKKVDFSRETLPEEALTKGALTKRSFIKKPMEKTPTKLGKTFENAYENAYEQTYENAYEKDCEKYYEDKKRHANGLNEKAEQDLSGQKYFWQSELSQEELDIDALLPTSLSEPLLLRWQKARGEDDLSSGASFIGVP